MREREEVQDEAETYILGNWTHVSISSLRKNITHKAISDCHWLNPMGFCVVFILFALSEAFDTGVY